MSIISFESKFAFIKTKKVAGTSVEALLRSFTGDNDIVPAVTPRDEHFSAEQGNFSKNYLRNRDDEVIYTELVMSGDYDRSVEFLSKQRKIAFSHMGYDRVIDLIKKNGEDPESFYYFTIDRHPYSWLLSSVLYNNSEYNSKGKVDFELNVSAVNKAIERFLSQSEVKDKINWNKYTHEDKVLVDKVVDYDNLEKGLEEVFERLGIKNKGLMLPDLKKSSRDLDAFELLSDKNKQIAQEVFNPLFSYMKYRR